MRREIGRHLVIDSEIHHGEITFRDTRIPVASVLDDVADGTDWDTIVQQWNGSVTKEAIGEAVRLAIEALVLQHRHTVTATPARA
ncbi:MAG TPA: DUF433 domain-containing protein [Chloroflexota bacterium]|nr:DUF433 domain-containing protein [Chloroflexota bacterium]